MQNEIELQINSLFGRRHTRHRRCATHELARLCRDISENWESLDEAYRQR